MVVGLFLWGGKVGRCLGPLGVTAIECARATGIYPSVGIGGQIVAATVLIAALLVMPGILRPPGPPILGGVAGGIAAVAVYLAVRPTTWTDAISTGEIITVTLPLDGDALVTAAVLGVTAGLVLVLFSRHVTSR